MAQNENKILRAALQDIVDASTLPNASEVARKALNNADQARAAHGSGVREAIENALYGVRIGDGSQTKFDAVVAELESALAAHAAQDSGRQAVDAVAALKRLEDANNQLCSLRTDEQYLSMVNAGQQDALDELDEAREVARRIIDATDAAVPAPSAAPAQRMYMDQIDAGTAGEEWLEQHVAGAASMLRSDEPGGGQCPRVRWVFLFDRNDRLTHGYLLTRDIMNWTQITFVDAIGAAPVQMAQDKLNDDGWRLVHSVCNNLALSGNGDAADRLRAQFGITHETEVAAQVAQTDAGPLAFIAAAYAWASAREQFQDDTHPNVRSAWDALAKFAGAAQVACGGGMAAVLVEDSSEQQALPEGVVDKLAQDYCAKMAGRNYVQTYASIRGMAEAIAEHLRAARPTTSTSAAPVQCSGVLVEALGNARYALVDVESEYRPVGTIAETIEQAKAMIDKVTPEDDAQGSGMQVMPVEPTTTILAAMQRAVDACPVNMSAVYAAALSAHPARSAAPPLVAQSERDATVKLLRDTVDLQARRIAEYEAALGKPELIGYLAQDDLVTLRNPGQRKAAGEGDYLRMYLRPFTTWPRAMQPVYLGAAPAQVWPFKWDGMKIDDNQHAAGLIEFEIAELRRGALLDNGVAKTLQLVAEYLRSGAAAQVAQTNLLRRARAEMTHYLHCPADKVSQPSPCDCYAGALMAEIDAALNGPLIDDSTRAAQIGVILTEHDLGAIDNAASHLDATHELPVTAQALHEVSKRGWAARAVQGAPAARKLDNDAARSGNQE